jgi:WD40-like Beta Propeller Repeat
VRSLIRTFRSARGLCPLLAAVAALLFPPAATATFPGRDGQLAVQPTGGGGLLLVNPSTGTSDAVCTDAQLCGDPVDPRWSADGRALVFDDAASSRPVILASDGSCLWCLLGPPLANTRGGQPAFTGAGELTIATAHGLWRIALDGSRAPARILTGQVAEPAWSARGALAFVRGGAIWIRGSGHARVSRLVRGAAPAWSPDGKRLAFARSGWVWTVVIGDHSTRRLSRGGEPTWSPDGRSIAYISPTHAVEVVQASGGPPRRIGSITGDAVDWQPLPRSSASECRIPEDATSVTRTSGAVVYETQSREWYGCVYLVPTPRPLGSNSYQSDGDYESVGKILLAGRFVLLASGTGDKYGDCTNGLGLIDLASDGGEALDSQTCTDSYVPVISPYVLDSSGFSAWETTTPVEPQTTIAAISCAAPSLCVATDAAGNVLASTAPAGGAESWQSANVDGSGSLDSISCPTTGLCVAVDGDGEIASSTDPTGPAADWSRSRIAPVAIVSTGFSGVSCPTAALCVAVGSREAWTSNAPTGGAAAWPSTTIDNDSSTVNYLTGVSCPSASLCVAVDHAGNVLTSTAPAGGPWTSTPTDTQPSAVSCPSAALCVTVGIDGEIATSTNPIGPSPTWTVSHVGNQIWASVTCQSTALCVAVGQDGTVAVSDDPSGGASAWTTTDIDGSTTVSSVSCPAADLCVATDEDGNVLTTANPLAGSWTSAAVDQRCEPETPCDGDQLYAHDDHGTRLLDSTPPGPGGGLANLELSGDSTTLSWTDNGQPNQLGLG